MSNNNCNASTGTSPSGVAASQAMPVRTGGGPATEPGRAVSPPHRAAARAGGLHGGETASPQKAGATAPWKVCSTKRFTSSVW